MPKIKTNSGAAKRFKKTGSGHFKHKQSFTSHILTKKTSKRKRQLRAHHLIDQRDEHAIRQLLPYSG